MSTVFLHRLAKLPNAWLLFSLIVLVAVYPFLEPFPGGRAAIAVFDLVVLLLALRAARATGPEARVGYLLVWPAMALHMLAAFFPSPWLVPANLVTQAAFHGFVVVCLLRYVLRDDIMTLDELFALPFAGVMLLAIALWRGVRNDWNEEQRRERTLRKRMREMVDAPGR